jgi:hypothetical protein
MRSYLFKPMDLTLLLDVIKQRVAIGPVRNREVETVAAILDRTSYAAIQEWYKLVQTDELVMSVSMSRDATEQFGQYRFRSVVGWSHGHRRRNRFAAESSDEKLLRRFARRIYRQCSSNLVRPPSPVISQLPILELASPHRIPNVGASKQEAGNIYHRIQSAARKRICILAVPEITSRIEQAEVDHRTTGYRSSDSGARIAGNQPVAGYPKRSRDKQNIGQEKAPLEIYDVCRKLTVVCPEGDPEKSNGQCGYPLHPCKPADG